MRSGATGTPWPVSQNSAVLVRQPEGWLENVHDQVRSTFLGPPDQLNGRRDRKGLPRKEVIQPHLPVRLPCYDFTPIMSPTFDGFLP
jgi:hypothetical protein